MCDRASEIDGVSLNPSTASDRSAQENGFKVLEKLEVCRGCPVKPLPDFSGVKQPRRVVSMAVTSWVEGAGKDEGEGGKSSHAAPKHHKHRQQSGFLESRHGQGSEAAQPSYQPATGALACSILSKCLFPCGHSHACLLASDGLLALLPANDCHMHGMSAHGNHASSRHSSGDVICTFHA